MISRTSACALSVMLLVSASAHSVASLASLRSYVPSTATLRNHATVTLPSHATSIQAEALKEAKSLACLAAVVGAGYVALKGICMAWNKSGVAKTAPVKYVASTRLAQYIASTRVAKFVSRGHAWLAGSCCANPAQTQGVSSSSSIELSNETSSK